MSGRGYNLRVALETRAILAEKFPNCFVVDKAPKRPLKVDIVTDIRARLPELAGGRIARALFTYTDGPTYLDTLVEGAQRVDLDGGAAGQVTAEEAKAAARRSLGIREARHVDRRLRLLKAMAMGMADVVAWWDDMPAELRRDIEIRAGIRAGEPICITQARQLCSEYVDQQAERRDAA